MWGRYGRVVKGRRFLFSQDVNGLKMSDETNTNKAASSANVQTLLASFRHVGMPLLRALSEAHRDEETGNKVVDGINAEKFSALIDSTVALSRELANMVGAGEGELDAWVRWALVGSASQVVASNYTATGKAMTEDNAKHLAQVAATLQEKFKSQIPSEGETIPNTVGTFRAKTMEAMVPVVGAVAQYSFGRAEHNLLAEVAERLVKVSDQMTRALAPAGATPEQWRLLCWNVLRAAGEIYAESHYAEADRLLYMNPDERTEYFEKHNNTLPMTQVWQAFNQRMAMLATMATYLEVPDKANLEAHGWQ